MRKAPHQSKDLSKAFPENWDVKPLSALTQYITYGFTNPMPTTKDGPWMLTAFDIAHGRICYENARHTSERAFRNDLTQKSKPQVGDILITKDGTLGRVAVVDRTDICINQSVACLRPLPDTDVNFLVHYLTSDLGQERMLADAGGSTIKHIYITKLAELEIPIPPKSEREEISNILDDLNQTIAHTSTLIAKLKQMKAGLLHDLLTRGLDENGKLRDAIEHPEQFKDSPLGQIPKDWEVMSLHSACSDVVDCPHTTPVFRNEGVLVARTSNIRDGSFDERNASKVSQEEYYQRISRLEPMPGDIVFTREAPVGEAFLIPIGMKICLGQRTMLLRPNLEKITPEYIIAQIYSGAVRTRIQQLVGGTTNPHLNVAEVRDFTLPVPPVKEQLLMTATLNTHTKRINAEESYLTKLKEQKKGLMHDLLTGRVRVTDLKEIPA